MSLAEEYPCVNNSLVNKRTQTMRPPDMRRLGLACSAVAFLLSATPAAWTQENCRNTGNFDTWLAAFKREALSQGISQATINAASPYLVFDQRILNIDRSQRFFAQTFLEISEKMLAGGRIPGGIAKIKQYKDLFAREEKEFGVPAAVITAFWGLESDFGAGQGKDHSIKSIATLAFDCRRPDMFRAHLLDSLRIIERGDLRPEEMIGSWAGELGQTQFMPSEYMAHAVDYDGDGHRNLIKSVPDVIGSTGKYLVHLGWKRGEPWLHEVRVPQNLKWEEADLTIQHPRSQWARWGVNRELQQLLQRRGYDVGRIDGVLGLKSRSAVREIQIKLGMPADSWPTPELLQRLRGEI